VTSVLELPGVLAAWNYWSWPMVGCI